jgi:hypothetical protein
MRTNKVDDEQVWQLINERMDELGVTLNDVVEQNPYLALLIKRRIAGYPVPIDDARLYQCAQLLGLITHSHASGRRPSRDELIILLRYGESPYPRQVRFVDWGCNGEH